MRPCPVWIRPVDGVPRLFSLWMVDTFLRFGFARYAIYATFNLKLSMFPLPNYTTISLSGASSLLSDDFHDLHLVLFGDLEKNKEQLSADKTKNGRSGQLHTYSSLRML